MATNAQVVDEVAGLSAIETTLSACLVQLGSLSLTTPPSRRNASPDSDNSDSDDDALVGGSRRPLSRRKPSTTQSRGMRSAGMAHRRHRNARERADQAMRDELASTPADPRVPDLARNPRKMRTDEEETHARVLVSTAVERGSEPLSAIIRAGTATDAQTVEAVCLVLHDCVETLRTLRSLNFSSYQHMTQRVFTELVSCYQRSSALATPGLEDSAAVPDSSLSSAGGRGSVVTGDGSDVDSSAPSTPAPATPGSVTDDEGGSPFVASSDMLLDTSRAFSYRRMDDYDDSMGAQSDLDC